MPRVPLLCVLILLTAGAAPAADDDGFSPMYFVQRGGKATYALEDRAIVGTSVCNTDNTFLCTPRDYGDFILEVEVRVDDGLNSGIQVRSHAFDTPREYSGKHPNGEPWKATVPAGRVHGYQVEIDPSDRSWSGGVYDEARRGWLYNLAGDERAAARAAFKRGEWNLYRIEARGDSIKTSINGVPVADLTDTMDPTGFIAFQVHSIGGDKRLEGKQVRWRNARIKEL